MFLFLEKRVFLCAFVVIRRKRLRRPVTVFNSIIVYSGAISVPCLPPIVNDRLVESVARQQSSCAVRGIGLPAIHGSVFFFPCVSFTERAMYCYVSYVQPRAACSGMRVSPAALYPPSRGGRRRSDIHHDAARGVTSVGGGV